MKLGCNVTQPLGHIPSVRRVHKRQSSVPGSQSTCHLISTTQSLDAKEQLVEISNGQDMLTGDLFSNVESFSVIEMKPKVHLTPEICQQKSEKACKHLKASTCPNVC